MTRIFWVFLLSVFLICVGCTASKTPHDYSPEATASILPTQVLASTPMITISKTPSPIASLESQQKVISPKLINICPENRGVSVEKIELPKGLHLLLLPNTVEAYPQVPGKPLSISSESLIPTTILDEDLYDYSVSPDYHWIYFSRQNDDKGYPVLWISSLDGKKQWSVIELGGKGYAGYASWVSEKEIFLIGSPNANDISALNPWDYMPFMSVDPFTLEKETLTYLERDQQEDLFYYGTIGLDNNSLGMYGRFNRVDFIYDYKHDKTIPVFSWLDVVEPIDMQLIKPIWVYNKNLFAITIARPDGIDIAFNLNIRSAGENKRYDDVMNRIILPEQFLPASVLGIIPGKNVIALQRFDYFSSSQGKNWFYVLDYNNQIIYDYCFDLQHSVKRVKFSPNGKFAAISLENSTASMAQDQHYVVILNLEKGTIAYLKGYTLVDWGVLAP